MIDQIIMGNLASRQSSKPSPRRLGRKTQGDIAELARLWKARSNGRILLCELINQKIPAFPRCVILSAPVGDSIFVSEIRATMGDRYAGLTFLGSHLDRLPEDERIGKDSRGTLLFFTFSEVIEKVEVVAPPKPIIFPSLIPKIDPEEAARNNYDPNVVAQNISFPRNNQEKNVLFVTNRKRNEQGHFINEVVGDLTWGSALVTEQQTISDNQPIYAVVTGFVMEMETFMNMLQSDSDQVLLVIHGFHKSLEKGIESAAMVQFQCGFAGSVISFCWPSDAQKRTYEDDEIHYLETLEVLHQLITLLRLRGKRVHIMGMNVGCELARLTLMQMDPNEAKKSHVLFLCPDISWTDFWGELGIMLQRSVASIQYFYYPNDPALFSSEWYYHTERRLGQEQSHNPAVCFSHRSHDPPSLQYTDEEHNPLMIQEDREMIKRLVGVF